MAKTRLVKNNKGQYGIYDPWTDQVTPITSDMSLVKNTRGKYGFKSGNQVFELDEMPKSVNLEQTFKKKVGTASSSATSSTGSTSDFYKEVGAKPAPITEDDHKEVAKAKIAEKQAQGSRFIDMFGLGQLDYSGLQKYGAIGEFAADLVDIPANLSQALMRGIGAGVIGSELHDSLENGEKKIDSDKLARINKENAVRTGSTYLDTMKQKGILQTDDLSAAGGFAEVVVESFGNMIGAYKKAAEGAVVGGAAGMAATPIAAEIGATVGGPLGAAIGSAVSTGSAALMGMRGMVSYATEYGNSIMESLQKNGVDITDKNQLEKAFKNKSVIDEARNIANTRGLTIGMFDAITDGIAGKGAKIAVKVAERSALKSGKTLTKQGVKNIAGRTAAGIELAGGPLGEATAQLATEGKITDYDAVALEALADLGPAAPRTAYAMYKAGQINSDLNQENLNKIDDLKKAKDALPDENQASKKALDNKIAALEKENKDRNKAMTSALQVAPVPATKRVLELTDAIQDIEATLEAIKDGSRTDISQEAKKAMWDSMNDMIAEREEIRQEMLKASENESKIAAAPDKPMVPVVSIKPIGKPAKEGEVLPSPVPENNATQLSKNIPLEVKKVEEPVMFSPKFDDDKSAKQATAYKVSQGENNFGTIIEHNNNGEKEFVLAETGKKYASLDDAKFALQEKLTGERVSEMDRVGINRIKVEGNLANKPVFIGNEANNNQLDLESKGAIQKAVRALRSVSNANVYLYSNSDDYAKGIAHATGQDVSDVANNAGRTNAQVVDANGENSIHINLEKADITSLSHEVFHGALLGLAKKDPNAFITMRDKILDRISEKKSLSVTENGVPRKVSAKDYLQNFQQRYSGPEYTEADRAEEFLSELAGLMSLKDNDVVKDKSLLDSIKLTIKDVLKKFNIEFDSLNELQDSEDMVQFFKDFNRSLKTGEAINLSKVEGMQGAAPQAQAQTAVPVATTIKTSPKGSLTKFSIMGQDNRFNPANANPNSNYVHYGVDEEGDVFMIAPESKLPAMIHDYTEYLSRLYDINVPSGMRMAEGKGVMITELPKVDSQGNLVKKGKLTFTSNQTIKYGIEQKAAEQTSEAPVAAQPAATQPATQQPTTPSQQVTPSTVTPAEPVSKGANFKETKSGGKESELFPLLTIKREENFKLSDEEIFGKTKIDKKGNTTTEFYTKFGDKKIPVSGKAIYYDNENNKFNQDRKGKTGRNGEGGRLLNDFEKDYGISFDEVLKGLGIKLKANEEVLNFRIDKESIEMHPVSGALKKVHGKVSIIKKGTNGMESKDTYISYYTPKLKYTDEITGISTAQPEAGAVKENVTTRPEGAKKKEPIAKVISRAADKAQESVKKKTKGNTTPISERVAKVEGILGQALRIEPASAYDLALQYFIGGGRVLRGKVTNGAKPEPHTLITLFTKPKQGYYVASEAEMASRGFLTKKDGLLITEIAHKLWESQANESLGFDESEMRSAVEAVLLDHATTSSMAKDIISRHGNPEQRSLISGKNDMSGLSDYEMFVAGQIADEFGVSVEEVIDNPEKFVRKDELKGMQEDMLTAFEILDELQDDEAVKEYLGISAPEDLFLDELVAEVAKPEKTLQEKKADLEKQLKDKKKELAKANKKKNDLLKSSSGQISLIEGTQTNFVPPVTKEAYKNILNIEGDIEEIKYQLRKVESAIEFKERNTIDAFADVMDQKVEETAPEAAPENEEEKTQWLKEQEEEYALRDKEDAELTRLNGEVYRAKNKISNSKDAEAAINYYNEAKAKLDSYEKSVNKRRQDRADAQEIQSLIQDEINDSKNPKYQYAEDFKKSPLLAAYKRAQEILLHVSENDYVDYLVNKGIEPNREAAIAEQEKSIANYDKKVFLIETAIAKESMSEQAAKEEPAQAESSKNEKEIKSLESEIEQYEREIEDATEEIENTKYNYREAVNEIKAEKKGLAESSMSKEKKAEMREELDARLEDAADERDTYIEQYNNTISEAKAEIKKLQKQIDKLKVTTKAQLSGERIVSGDKVWGLIESITPNENDVPNLSKSSISNREYTLDNNFELKSLLKSDKSFKEYYNSAVENGEFRYEESDVNPEDLNNPIVVVDGELRDGYSRATTLLSNGETTTSAYVATPKITTKAQLSGERITPFQKVDPTYKYQMSGTEASLNLIDNIRKKYNMQHTAEEMGMVGKGVRATEKAISDNVVTRALSKVSVSANRVFSNEKANKIIGMPLNWWQGFLSNNIRKGLGSQNAAAASASAIAVSLIQNLGSTEGFQTARNKLSGGKSVAKNQLWQLGKDLNDMINNDKLALRRVHSLLDPEAFEGVTDPTLPDSKSDLSFAELRLFNTLRDMNDFIHEWHYQNGFLGEGPQAEALYEKNKGSYFARMYNEIETKKFEDLYDALAKLPNAADFSMFKERKDFLSVTENLTLKEDPIYITTKRFGQMMQNQAILEFCDYVAKSKDYQIYKNKEDIPAGAVKNYRLLAPKRGVGKVYGALTNKYVPDIVAQQLQGVEFSNQVINLTYQAAKIFDKSFARQILSKSKTVWNPLTRAGNITMNFVFASLAGVDPVTLLKNRPAAKESLDNYDSYARDLDQYGLLGVSMGKELNNEKDENAKRILKDAANRLLKREGKQTKEIAPAPPSEKSKFRKIASDLDDFLTESYGKSDDVAKVALYKSLVDDYGKTREEAIRIVASSMQNYNTVGKAYDYASKSVNRFVKFKADSARILYNSFKDRPLNLMATLGMFLAAQALASKVSGEDEEERKIREERPYTNKIKIGPVTISLTMKFGDTEINVARYLAPYSMYDAGYDYNALKEMSTYLPVQYDENTLIAINDPLIGPLINLVTDKDFRGMPISDPGKTPFINKTVTDTEARWNQAAFLARNFASPYWAWGENLIAASTGDKDYYGRTRTMSEAMLNTFIKVQSVDNESLQRTYIGALRKLDRDVDNISKTISHNRKMMNDGIADKASQEGITNERLQEYIKNAEAKFLNFRDEQYREYDMKRQEMEKVQLTIGKLQEIKQRQNKK